MRATPLAKPSSEQNGAVIDIFKMQENLRPGHFRNGFAPAESGPVNHLLVRSVAGEILQMNVLGPGGFSGPYHERYAANGELALLCFPKDDVIGQTLVALFEDLRVFDSAGLPIQEPVELIHGKAAGGGDDLATVKAVTWVCKARIELTEFVQRKKLNFNGGGVKIFLIDDQVFLEVFEAVNHPSGKDNVGIKEQEAPRGQLSYNLELAKTPALGFLAAGIDLNVPVALDFGSAEILVLTIF